MKTINLFILLIIMALPLAGCVGIGGENIALSHEPLAKSTQQYSEKLALQKPAEDMRLDKRYIGRTTFTAFAITTGRVISTSPIEEQIIDQIKDGLSSMGYQVELTRANPEEVAVKQIKESLATLGYRIESTNGDKRETSSLGLLRIKIALNDIWFKNYNWFFPLVPTWGDIKISLVMENSGKKKLFEKTYEGSGNSFCLSGHCAFETATQEAMTEILNQIIKDFSSSKVRNAIVSEHAAGVAAPIGQESPSQ
jgi:hypothetical protein